MSEYRMIGTEAGLVPVVPESAPGVVPHQPETDSSPQPHVKAIMWEHSPENNDATVKQLQDCDVVAFEHRVFKDNEERKAYDRAATIYASTTATEEERREAGRVLDKFDFNTPQYKSLLESLKGSDKRIATLDMDKDDPNYNSKVNKENPAFMKADKLSVGQIKTELVAFATESAKWDEARESRMVEQARELVGEYTGQDVNIAIMAGGAHTPVYHQLAKEFPGHVERVFAVPREAGQTRPEKVYYDPVSQLRRHARFTPDKPIPDATLDRAVLHVLEHDSFSLTKDADVHSRAIEDLSDAQVSELITALDGLKAGIKAKVLRRAIAKRAGRMIAAKVTENAPRTNRAA